MIVLEGVTFAYRPGQTIVEHFTGRFASGSTTALVGRSGSGKSTLLYLLGLMLSPARGVIEVAGMQTVGLSDAQRSQLRAQTMGFVFQDAMLDPARSIIDNVTEGSLYTGQDPVRVEQRACELLAYFGVDGDLHRRPGQISGGQAQRVALCRSFVKEPSIVLADEPTGNLDEVTADLVWGALADMAVEGCTVVVATHDRRRAATCDQVIEVGYGPTT